MSQKIKIIAGPCQHESLEHSMMIAQHCSEVCEKHGVEYIFKASFDKANRTHADSKRGIGIDETLDDFDDMKAEFYGRLKILTDIHEYYQAYDVAKVVDVIQIPAFLCRQTDLIEAACNTDCVVNIKKGQFLAPWDIEGILSKTKHAKEVWITERGTSFGYNNLVVDFNGLQYMLDTYDTPIVFDATHSVQQPGGRGHYSGGNSSYVPGLCRAASALGVSNFFLEVHDNPTSAPSDGANMLHLKDFEETVKGILKHAYDNQ